MVCPNSSIIRSYSRSVNSHIIEIMKKYTDLEQFSLKNIINPYQNMMDFDWCGHSHDCSCDGARGMSLDEVVEYIKKHEDSEWWKCVVNRLKGIKKGSPYYFPKYIKHELLEILDYNLVK